MINELDISSIDKVVLVNSATYAYFELDLNNNVILEGGNNEGKTSVLNALQFLLLPEENLNNIAKKFRFKPKDDDSMFTKEETYDFYFSSNSSSFLIFQITNKFGTFSVIIYGYKRQLTEFRRIIIPEPYSDIKKMFVNDKDEPQNIFDKNDIFDMLKNKYGSNYKEISKLEDIKKYFFTVGRNNEYNIVPLKDTQSTTVENYKVLLKSLYDASSMDENRKVNLVSDIISSQQKRDNNSDLSFNVEDFKESTVQLRETKRKLENLENFKDDFYELKDIFDNSALRKGILLSDVSKIYHSITIESKECIEYDKNFINEQDKLLEDKKEVRSRLDNLKEQQGKKKGVLSLKKDEYETAIHDFTKISNDNPVEYFEDIDIMKYITTENNKYKNIIKDINTELCSLRELLETKNRAEQLNLKKTILLTEIDKIKKSIKNIKQKIEDNNLLISEKFTNEEKFIFDTIFSDSFRILNNEDIPNIEFVTKFIGHFDVKDNKVFYNDRHIKGINKQTNVIEILEDQLTLSEGELHTKQIALDSIVDSIDDFNSSTNDNGLLTKIKNNEFEIIKYNKYINIVMQLSNIILTIKSFNDIEVEFTKNIKAIDEDIFDINTKYIKIETDLKDSEFKISENNKTKNILYRIKEEIDNDGKFVKFILDNNSSVNEYVENNIQKIKDLGLISDISSSFNISKRELDTFYESYYRTDEIIRMMDTQGLLNTLSSDTISNYTHSYQDKLHIINYLNSEYQLLDSSLITLGKDTHDLGVEINNGLMLLNQIKKNIVSFEKTVNGKFENIQISNLNGVHIQVHLNKELLQLINKFEKGLNSDDLNYLNHITQISNYLFNKAGSSKNTINIQDLIDKVEIKTILHVETDEDGKKRFHYSETAQSTGTQITVMIVFISILLDSLYKEGYSLHMPLIIDEIGKIDDSNISNLLTHLNAMNFYIIGATPNASPNDYEWFNVITVNQTQMDTIITNNNGVERKFIVSPNSSNPIFSKSKVLLEEKTQNIDF